MSLIRFDLVAGKAGPWIETKKKMPVDNVLRLLVSVPQHLQYFPTKNGKQPSPFCTNWPNIKFDFDHRNLPAISWWFSFVSSRHTASTQLAERTEMGPGLQLAKTRKSEQLIGPPATGAPPTELRKMAWLRPAGSVFFFFFLLDLSPKKIASNKQRVGPKDGQEGVVTARRWIACGCG